MTDNEIIKALECCNDGTCSACPISDDTCCISRSREGAIDIINRQKAEIERLQTVKKHIQNLILRDCDYSDTESYNKAFKKALERLYDNGNIKSEAVKEFAEKVKMAFYYEFDELIPSIMADKIDNLVKEMVGAE